MLINQTLTVIDPKEDLPEPDAGQMNSALIHEIRNPLTSINLAAVMLDSVMVNAEGKQYVDIIKRSTARINLLVENLFKNQPKKRKTDYYSVLQLLNEVVESVKDRMFLKNIILKKNFSQDCSVLVSQEEIKIAFTNIIINAIDAMSYTDGELELSTVQMEDKFMLIIKDNGCGISEQNLEKIFTPLFTNKSNGLGIGLAATRYFFQLNNVSVKIRSQENIGTSFCLVFNNSITSRHMLTVPTFEIIDIATITP
jgi:signal transduction histidine kinase